MALNARARTLEFILSGKLMSGKTFSLNYVSSYAIGFELFSHRAIVYDSYCHDFFTSYTTEPTMNEEDSSRLAKMTKNAGIALHTMAYRATLDLTTPLYDVALQSTSPMTLFNGELPFGGSPSDANPTSRTITSSRSSVHGGFYVVSGPDALIASLTGYDYKIIYVPNSAMKCFDDATEQEVPGCTGFCSTGDVCVGADGVYAPSLTPNAGQCEDAEGTADATASVITVTCEGDTVFQCFDATDNSFLP